MDKDSIYASTTDILTRANIEQMVKSTRKLSAKLSIQDMIGIFTFIVLLPLGFIYTIFYTLPFWYRLFSQEWTIRVFFLVIFGVNVYLNALKIVKTGPNGVGGGILPSVQKPGYHFCHECQLNQPPRSFHCPICNTCILRRDHHCSFVGSCVGHFNHRYFMAAIINLLPITIICSYWSWCALFLHVLQTMQILEIWKLMFPHVALMLQYISFWQFFMVASAASSTAVSVFVIYLIGAQLFCFARGQTRVEYLMDIHAYDLGVWENVRQALGDRWSLIIFSPFISSPLQSDGLSFKTREGESIVKSTKHL